MNPYIAAYQKHRDAAHRAMILFREMCDYDVPRVPGMDTAIRLAWRIECGRTEQEAAAREFVYRFNLAIDRARAFGAPTTLGR